MLPFFRKIRWRLAANNQFFKYSRYAIGEIVLVVIGILIALYINNWNEERKDQEVMNLYKRALCEDLEKDIIQLTEDIEKTAEDLENCESIGQMISSREISIDSIIRIYRSDFNFFIYVDVNFHRNSIDALLYTGDIKLFEDSVYNDLIQFNNIQNDVISSINTELGFYTNYLTQSNLPQTDKTSVVQGEALDRIWELIDRDDFILGFNIVLNSKSIVNRIMLGKRRLLLEQTEALLDRLSKLE